MDRVRVGDVLHLERRVVDVELDHEYEEIGVRSFGRGIFHKERVSGIELGNKRVFRIEPHDLVISNVFAWEGAIAVASEAEAGKIGSHRFMTFVPTDGRIDTTWAAWFFRNERGLELIGNASPGSAGRNRTLAIDRFEELEIQLPAIGEQRLVAERLNRVEAAARELREQVERASSLSNVLAVSTVTRNDLTGSAKALAGWRRVRLDQVVTQRNDEVAVQAGHTYDIAGVYSFGRGMFRRTGLEGSRTSYRALHRLHAGQVVMSRLKAWEGAVAVVPAALDGWFLSPEFPTFDIDAEQVITQYFHSLIISEQFWSRLGGASRGIGARRERVHAARLLEQEIDLPPLSAQRYIARILGVLSDADEQRSSVGERIKALLPAAINEAFASLS